LASIEVHTSGQEFRIEVTWNYEPLVAAIGRLVAQGTAASRVVKVVGRRVNEYSPGAARALSGYSVVHIPTKDAFKQYMISHCVASNDQMADIASLFEPMSDWALDRYNVSSRNGDLWSWSADEVSAKVFAHESSSASSGQKLAKSAQIVAEALRGKVVVVDHIAMTSCRFTALLPLISRASEGSVWVLMDDGGAFRAFSTPVLERDYLNHEDVVSVLATLLNVSPSVANGLTRRHKGTSFAYDDGHERITRRGFDDRVSFYLKVAGKEKLEELPDVPQPQAAPLQFGIKAGRLELIESASILPSTQEVMSEVVQDLIDLADDVINHHNLSNVAPILSAKATRLRAKLVSLQQSEPSDAKIISLGVLTAALGESLEDQKDDLFSSARGAIKSLSTQSAMFVNRFEAWREYVRSSEALEAYSDPALVGPAMATLSALVEYRKAIEPAAEAQVRALMSQITEGATSEERKGLVATVQNILAIAATFAKEVVVKGTVLAGKIVEKAFVTQAAHAAVLFVISAEPMLNALAVAYPKVFWWLPAFVEWLKASTDRP